MVSAALVARPPPALDLQQASPSPRVTGWKRVKIGVALSARVADLSIPYKIRRDEARMQRKHGTSIGPRAQSPRWDIQQCYRELFFPVRVLDTDAAALDPWGGENEAAGHWSSAGGAIDNYAHRRARDRLQALETLKRRIRSEVSRVGLDWDYLFDQYGAPAPPPAPRSSLSQRSGPLRRLRRRRRSRAERILGHAPRRCQHRRGENVRPRGREIVQVCR